MFQKITSFLVFLPTVFCSIISDLTLQNWTLTDDQNRYKLTIKVPNDVYMALFQNGQIPDPYFENNDLKVRHLAYSNWNLSTLIRIPENATNHVLIADSIDTAAKIYLNGRLVSKTDNMFNRYSLDITPFFHGVENSTLTLEFVSPVKYANFSAKYYKTKYGYEIPPGCPLDIQHGECHVNMLRKMQCSFSWDWGPAFPTMGVYRSFYLKSFVSCTVDNVSLIPILKAEISRWSLMLEFEIYCPKSPIYAPVEVDFGIPNLKNFSYTVALNCSFENRTTKSVQLAIEIPQQGLQLWHPNGNGEQNIYDAVISIKIDSKREIFAKKLAFRSVELIQNPVKPRGLSFYFKINGIETFLKGSNWIPADSFQSRIDESKLRFYFHSMKSSNMNCLRVWGGGVYESDLFYDLADEYGIMIWQDMMFAVSLYPGNYNFLRNVEQEVKYQVARLKHHPCIIVWAGNNENEQGLADGWFLMDPNARAKYYRDYKRLYADTIFRSINESDPTRPFLISSPSNGAHNIEPGAIDPNPNDPLYGDMHFYAYKSNAIWDPNSYPKPRCVTEYGFQSFSSLETLSKYLEEKNLKFFSESMLHRQHHAEGHWQMLNLIFNTFHLPAMECENLGNISDVCSFCKTRLQACYVQKLKSGLWFSDLIYLIEIYQAMAYKSQTEHYRRMRSIVDENGYGGTMCALYWQLNDIWPAISWSTIDFGQKWKMAHSYARKFFQSLLISPFIENSTHLVIFVISDLLIRISNVTLLINVHTLERFEPIYNEKKFLGSIDPLESREIYRANFSDMLIQSSPNPEKLNIFFSVYILDEKSKVLSHNVQYPNDAFLQYRTKKYGHAKIKKIEQSGQGVYKISVQTNRPAPFTFLDVRNVTGWFSDNGFATVNKVTVVYFYSWNKSITLKQISGGLSVKTLANVYDSLTSHY
uniref:Beta-mannosidase n=1 Tax=Romanomermis culicivorax TaxID=13658 RepID=A0A915KHW4_ROMCU